MKNIVVSCFFTLFVTGFINAQYSVEPMTNSALNWQSSFKKATSKAKSQNKPILLFFTGSDWCGPCKMLVADFFESEKFEKLADKELILYEVDFPRNQDLVSESQKAVNIKLKESYNVNSYPTLVVIDAKGNEIGRKKGYGFMRNPSYHFQFIESIIFK